LRWRTCPLPPLPGLLRCKRLAFGELGSLCPDTILSTISSYTACKSTSVDCQVAETSRNFCWNWVN
ncbi:hypothetical protein T4A_8228, partial [Trichinella pseudospiralis]